MVHVTIYINTTRIVIWIFFAVLQKQAYATKMYYILYIVEMLYLLWLYWGLTELLYKTSADSDWIMLLQHDGDVWWNKSWNVLRVHK